MGAIEVGYQASGIEDAAYAHARALELNETSIVGVNAHVSDSATEVPVSVSDSSLEELQVQRLQAWRSQHPDATESVDSVVAAAATESNILYPMKVALIAGATVGEISNALRSVFGVYRPTH